MQEVRYDGSEGPIEPFEEKKLLAALERADVESVSVFRLKKGMRVEIAGCTYKVIRVRDNGRVVLAPTGAAPLPEVKE